MKLFYKIDSYTRSGKPIYRFTATNVSGAYVEFSNRGARWLSAVVPDANGVSENVIVGYDRAKDYLGDEYYMGAVIGRFANRIANATFTLNGRNYTLEKNDGRNSNHGGYSGFHQKIWDWEELPDGVRFTLSSPDGEGGYPGNIRVAVEYHWSDKCELRIEYFGITDMPTYLNMTNHAYFNLTGKKCKIIGHKLWIPSHRILDTTAEFIPTGRRVEVNGTPFDFTREKEIGKDLYSDNEQLRQNKGYNHCYILKDKKSSDMVEAAYLTDPVSGRTLTVETDLPALLLYTAGYYIRPDSAVCFETQYYPDTPSHSDFPSCLLHPGEEYRHRTIFKFGIIEGR
ncbi:MAG: galactose mutarotase [Coprobacter sp.]|nr:galactose mutarotase [Coprobacter sp.]